MTSEQALQLLSDTTAQMQLTRPHHEQLVMAIMLLRAMSAKAEALEMQSKASSAVQGPLASLPNH